MTQEEIREFLDNMKSYPGWTKKEKDLSNEIEAIRELLKGKATASFDVIHGYPKDGKTYALWEKRDRLIAKRNSYRELISETDRVMDMLEESLRDTLKALYWDDKSYQEVAKQLGYSKGGLHKHIRLELSKIELE